MKTTIVWKIDCLEEDMFNFFLRCPIVWMENKERGAFDDMLIRIKKECYLIDKEEWKNYKHDFFLIRDIYKSYPHFVRKGYLLPFSEECYNRIKLKSIKQKLSL